MEKTNKKNMKNEQKNKNTQKNNKEKQCDYKDMNKSNDEK